MNNTTIVTDWDIVQYLKPSKCGLRVYLQMVDEPQGPPDPFDVVLSELTDAVVQEQVGDWVDDLAGKTYYRYGHPMRRINAARKGLREKRTVLFRPLLSCGRKVAGQYTYLDAQPDFLIREQDNYVIRVCEGSRVIDEKTLPATYARLRYCAYVFEQQQGQAPLRLEIVGPDGIIAVEPASFGQLSGWIDTVASFKRKNSAPWAPVGRTKCGACVFNQRCWGAATRAGDTAIVRGMDQGLSGYLRDRLNVRTVQQLLDRFDNDVPGLAAIERNWGNEKRKVGESVARSILVSARSLVAGKEILVQAPNIPASQRFVMFDLEGVPEKIDSQASIYLWGMQIFSERGADYVYDAALSPFMPDGDRYGWQEFLRRAGNIFKQYGDVPFVHWGRYERERVEAYVKLYGDTDGVAARVLANLLDLHVILNDCIALPLASYGLKVVEKYVGYKRTQEEYGTSLSIQLYMRARAATGKEQARLMEQLLTYNHEDLEGTWAVFNWLRKRDWHSLDAKTA